MSERPKIIKRLEPLNPNGNGTENGRPPENHAFSEPLLPIGGNLPSFEDIFGKPLDAESETNGVEKVKHVVYLPAVINRSGDPAMYYLGEKNTTQLYLPVDIQAHTLVLIDNPHDKYETFPHNKFDRSLVLDLIFIEDSKTKEKTAHILVTPPQKTTVFKDATGNPIKPVASVHLDKIHEQSPRAIMGTLSEIEVEQLYIEHRKAQVHKTAQLNNKSTQTFRRLT